MINPLFIFCFTQHIPQPEFDEDAIETLQIPFHQFFRSRDHRPATFRHSIIKKKMKNLNFLQFFKAQMNLQLQNFCETQFSITFNKLFPKTCNENVIRITRISRAWDNARAALTNRTGAKNYSTRGGRDAAHSVENKIEMRIAREAYSSFLHRSCCDPLLLVLRIYVRTRKKERDKLRY